MTTNPNIIDALKAVIATRNWDYAGELADDAKFVDCLRCFSAPRRILFDDETPCVYMCLFCASCWFEHEKHAYVGRGSRGPKVLTECRICDVIKHHRSMEQFLALQNLRAAERRFLGAFGWKRNGETWDPPSDQRFKYQSGYTHNHAVNALKQRQGEARQDRQQRDPRWKRPTDDDD